MNHQLITQREQEVLQLVAHEYTTPQIANRLYLSRHTVDSHKKNLKTKLAVKNAAGMVRRGFELGLLKMMSQQVNLVIILLATITFSITSVNAQQEVELRADGIVVPRTTTSNVTSPTTGMIIYDNNVEAFMHFNGSVWSVVGGGAFERVNGNVRPASPKAETDSFEFGSGRANGESSIAFGVEASADTTYAVAIGHGTTASGLGSIALGNNVTARGTSSFAAGSYNLVSGAYAASLGSENSASGDNAFTFGNFTYATQAASTAFGTFSRADADNATAFGQETQASGPRSTAFGNRTSASGEGATAFGQYSEARGNISTAFGLGVIAHGLGSTVVGTYNDTLVTVSSDDTDRPLFLVGNGTAGIVNGIWVEDRNNALVVRQNGQVEFDNYTFPIDDGISNQVMTSDGSGQLSWTTLADNDPNNEKQSLALSGNLLTLSNGGGNANLAYLDDWNTSSDGNSIYFNVGQGGDLGNVGIGTINPDARLEVYANGSSVANPTLELKEDNNNKFVHQAFSNRFATEKWLLKAKPKDTNSSSSAAFNFSYSEGNKNIMSLKGDGSVGIGMESTFDNTFASARLEIRANSAREYATLQLHETQNDFVRQAFSNTGSNEKWFFTADPNNDPSLGVFNIYHTDELGGTNALKLFGDGDAIIAKDLTVTGTYNPSDIRYKKDITSLGGTLSSISKLGGYRYNWKDENKPEPQIGLIAQEVQAVYPELVKENKDGMLSVNYTKMVPILLEAIKEQQEQINNLTERLESLEK